MKEILTPHQSTRHKVIGRLSSIINPRYLRNLLRLFRLEYKTYGWHITLLGVLSFLGGIMEGIGITAIIPIFSFVDKGKAESTDLISQVIEKFFLYLRIPYTLKFLLLFILVLFLTKAALVFFSNYVSASITTTYEKKTRSELLRLTVGSDWKYLSKQKIGHLSQILTTDVSNSSALLTYLSMFLITAINLVVYTLLAFNVSPIIAGVTVVFGVIVFFSFKPLLFKNKALSQEANYLNKDSTHFVDEMMIGAKAIKSMSLEKSVENLSYSYFERLRNLVMRAATLKNLNNALLQPLGIILILAIFAYFYKLSAFNFASFAVVVYAINKVFGNVEIGQAQLHKITSCVPYLASIVEHKQVAQLNQETDKGKKNFSFSNQLEFKHVNFSYTADRKILSDINFSIQKGQMVGIVGPSGSGKTTITDLILRLFEPTSGEILIDGGAIDSIKLQAWRTNIGYVSQDSFLVNDTIANNIKFYNKNLTKEDVQKAGEMAHIHDFIVDLPEKYETVVGERGVKLSGGQRQRIILARVLARKPQILILDEATSALDNESEALIQETISELKGSVTVIAIAHRLSTVMIADNLLVLEGGKIIEQGCPSELLKDRESYVSRVSNLR